MLGDYLNGAGYRTAVCGKTHIRRDIKELERYGIKVNDRKSQQMIEGFEAFYRDDGIHAKSNSELEYNKFLISRGYSSENPWHDFANSALGANGEVLTGWDPRNSACPIRIKEEESETAYTTNRALEFISSANGPWCLHLSYIKPHWPYMAPEPYCNMYRGIPVPPALTLPDNVQINPVLKAFQEQQFSKILAQESSRQSVIPTYMGLITQIDYHIGRVINKLDELKLLNNTIIVFTSDHGDFLGDYGLGEKDLFYDCITKVPLVIVDPRSNANSTRGTEIHSLVETIDLVPTFIELAGGKIDYSRLEGRSLCNLINGNPQEKWREAVFASHDFATTQAAAILNVYPSQDRGYMIRTNEWKYILYEGNFPPQLFDLKNDPLELNDLGVDERYCEIKTVLHEQLFTWFRQHKYRVCVSDEEIFSFAQKLKDKTSTMSDIITLGSN